MVERIKRQYCGQGVVRPLSIGEFMKLKSPRGQRRQVLIDRLKPMSRDRRAEGQIDRVQVFEISDNQVDCALSFETDQGTFTMFLDRKSLHRLGCRLCKL